MPLVRKPGACILRLYLLGLGCYGVLLPVLSMGPSAARGAPLNPFIGSDNDPARPTVPAIPAQQTPGPSAEPKSFFFDIPAQPLADALQRYAMISGRPALFSSAQVAGLTSSPVRGDFPADTALERLLAGTGLVAQHARSSPAEAFVLKAQPTATGPLSSGEDTPANAYAGRVQASVWAALCSNTLTRPGQYRTLLRFEIDATGALRQARLLTSTGDRSRDAAVLRVLASVRIEGVPPSDLAQPLTMVLLPRDPHRSDASPVCRAAVKEGRS
ncbi:hypothetical protein SG18_00330 [Pandoraea apista]|nr:hypothetical protein SG18_00330 [Pandoraea apista]AKH70960.1 hypothetical protein XM39_00330 [Pandoraea apista]AKI63232.1 hypothetical protein AA956_17650 [Pandoraea apista]